MHSCPFDPWLPGYDGNVLDAKPEDVADLDRFGVGYEILGWGNGVMRIRVEHAPGLEIGMRTGTNKFYYAKFYHDDE